RPGRGGVGRGGQGRGQGAHRGQGLRHAGRGRGGVPVQRLSITPVSAWSPDQAGRRLTCGNASEPSGQWWTEVASRGRPFPHGSPTGSEVFPQVSARV